MNDKEKILNKIKKCMALGDSANEHESARLYSVYRRGKKKTGRELDGLLWDGYPRQQSGGHP